MLAIEELFPQHKKGFLTKTKTEENHNILLLQSIGSGNTQPVLGPKEK